MSASLVGSEMCIRDSCRGELGETVEVEVARLRVVPDRLHKGLQPHTEAGDEGLTTDPDSAPTTVGELPEAEQCEQAPCHDLDQVFAALVLRMHTEAIAPPMQVEVSQLLGDVRLDPQGAPEAIDFLGGEGLLHQPQLLGNEGPQPPMEQVETVPKGGDDDIEL
eukprot:1805211-Alexandrium_andersonii.AAC.1